ncbi:hypothetical protein C8R46DRAFT_468925 [Mycena filopes]|nr:hypothetical protein C8R46DRAFT_468925 [Mycena filopes]
MLSSVLVILPFLTAIHAANDWKKPCVSGQCSYDLPQTSGTPASGTVQIWGSENAITDITTAAGWQILGCDPKALSQNVRLVCMDEDDPASNCGHLYQNNGAVDKIVRLPENCGASPFARISKSWVPDDQSIPATVKARLVRRGGSTPTVKALAIDTDWSSVDASKTGKVHFSVNAANHRGVAAAAPTVTPAPRAAPAAEARGFFGDVTKKIGSLAGDVTSVAGEVIGDVTSVADKVGDKITSVAGEVATKVETAAAEVTSLIGEANAFDRNKDFDIPPIKFDKNANLFNTTLGCGSINGAVSVNVAASVNAQPSLSFAFVGTFNPPVLTTFHVLAGLSGTASAAVTLRADIIGQIDSGKITLFSSAIPGLEIPGILEVGPIFDVSAEFTGELDLEMDLTVGVNLQLNNAKLTFPPDDSAKPDGGAFSLGDTPLKLSASPSVKATGTLTAHLIPTISFGIKALGGKADATIFVALDTSAALVLSLDASAKVTKDIGANSTASATASDDSSTTTDTAAPADTPAAADNSTGANSTASATASDDSTASTDTLAADNSTLPAVDGPAGADDTTALATRETSTSFGGCVAVNGGIAVNAGATGDFFGLFDKTASVSLFTKNFQIFKKCFGDAATASPTRRRRMRRVAARNLLLARAFSCPANGVGAPASVTDETVSSASITTT